MRYSPLVLRALAPYLPLDLLLDLAARIPQEPLLEEIKDPNGSIWSDRTQFELGEPPIPLRDYGTRYYHLWATQSLRPWGHFVFGFGPKNYTKTSIRARWAHYTQKVERTKGGDFSTHIMIGLWTPRGLECLSLKVVTKKNPLTLSGALKIINDPSYWVLVHPGPLKNVFWNYVAFRVIGSNGEYISYDLSSAVHIYKKNISSMYHLPRFQYLRPRTHGAYIYVINDSGKHFLMGWKDDRIEINNLYPEEVEETASITRIEESNEPEKLAANVSNPEITWAIDEIEEFEKIFKDPRLPPDELYAFPNEDRIKDFFEPLVSLNFDTSFYLTASGKVYRGRSYYPRDGTFKNFKLLEIPYRLSSYEPGNESQWAGIAW